MKTQFFRTYRLRLGTFFSIHREIFAVLFLLMVLVLVLSGSASASARQNLNRNSADQAHAQFSFSRVQNYQLYFSYPSSDDNWLGGTGNWSNAALWSAGLPGSNSDVFIGSGGNDQVNFNLGHASITSLTIGAATGTALFNGSPTSAQMDIAGALTVNQNGQFQIFSGETVNAGTFASTGFVEVGQGATLNLTSQPNGITDIAAGSEFQNWGLVTVGSNNGFGQLQNIAGRLTMKNDQVDGITPLGGTLTIASTGYLGLESNNKHTTIEVHGDVNNQGQIRTSGGAMTVSGALYNNGSLLWYGDGFVNVNRLTATGDLVNTGNIQQQFATIISTPHFSNSNYLSVSSNSAFLVGTGTAGTGYQQFADGVLTENLSDAFHYGIMFADTFSLDGTLDINLENGFTPQVGSSFVIGYSKQGGLSGQFANIINQFFNNGTEEWLVNYDNGHGYLELDVIGADTPEPGTLVLLGSGALGVCVMLRRKLAGA